VDARAVPERMRALMGYRDLVLCLVERDLKVRYRRSALGMAWTLLQPLLTMLVLHLVFSSFFRFAVDNYPVYALSGLLFWNFVQQSIVSSMHSLRGHGEILRKVPVPSAVFPLATVLSGVVNLLLALPALLLILLVTGHPVKLALLFLPAAIVIAAVFTLGLGLLLSPLAVFFSDVIEMVGVVLSLVLYLTPVFYPQEIVPARLHLLMQLNPVRAVLALFRAPIYEGVLPAGPDLLTALLAATVSLGLGVLAFRRMADRIPFHL
jgi:ABC-type polysaccharide/polyol phosphate export permease